MRASPLLAAARALLLAAAVPAAAAAAATDAYTNHHGGARVTPLLRHAIGSNPILVTHDGWLSAATIETAVPRAGVAVAVVVNGAVWARGAVHAVAPAVAPRAVLGFAPVPVARGDVVQLNASVEGQGAHAFGAGVVNHTWLAVDFVVTRLAPWVTVSRDDGSGTVARSYSFSSPPIATEGGGAPPPDATLVSYALLTDIWYGNIRSAIGFANGTDILVSWLQSDDGRRGVRWTTVGVPAAVGAAWPASRCNGAFAMHTSLQTNRLYDCGVAAGGSPHSAVANVTFRVPGPDVALGTDDGAGATADEAAFSSGALAVPPGGAGFVRALDLRTDTPLATQCMANVTVVAPPGRGPTHPREILLEFRNNGFSAATWRSLPLPAPLAVAGGSVITVSHACSGRAYTGAVRNDTGAAIVALRIDTFAK